MSAKKGKYSRRDFLKTAGAAGAGSALIGLGASTPAPASAKPAESGPSFIEKRPFGKSGADVSILGLGGVLKISDQLVFRQALKMGVTYWDTADSYGWGKNEKAIGKYFTKFPGDREKVFLVTKAATSDPQKLTEKLNASLQKMKTAHVDLYMIHYVSDVKDDLTDAVKAWAQKAKAEGKIRLFGFSTHKNMAASMQAAAKLGWIDGIMMSYNYRLMVKEEMKDAVAACVEAGIGLTAMKTQAAFSANFYSTIGSETDAALKMTEKFMEKGYTAEQARLKVVWEDPNVASICSAMSNMTILQANVAAALNRTALSRGDRQRLEQYAQRTSSGYCAGCAHICESVVKHPIPISDVMRYAMYQNGYGDYGTARHLFRQLPADVREKMLMADYSAAEARCPQKIKISRIMKTTCAELA